MDSSTLLRQLLRNPHTSRAMLSCTVRPPPRLLSRPSHARNLTILSPAFWGSMIPKPLKERPQTPYGREWNPATPYIILGLLVGSQAIQMLWLKQERAKDLRKAEAKIGVLREVIERVQRGEEVDVEEVLGTGDEAMEKEWADVVRDIREEESLFQNRKKRKAMREAAAKEEVPQESADSRVLEPGESAVKVETLNGAKFY